MLMRLSAVLLPREPQEVHSWYQDGLRWSEEDQGEERPHHVCCSAEAHSALLAIAGAN
jgi:hypothetical protein